MDLTELYTKETKVWVPDPANVWKCVSLLDDYKPNQQSLRVCCEDGREETVSVKSGKDLPFLRNPEILIGENDLTSLSYLHEPAGIVLVAINPYQQLHIYDNDTIRAYSGQDMAAMDPHIFAIAEEAFKRMSRFEENQSIIVSGESGAGKTVSAKYAMRYFATVCGAEAETQVEKRVLASNPIMEAIGNAKTTRNDNSSRFGKYIQICFSKSDHIMGANMRTYLLEKSRVVFQAPEERNYHIFYQLCTAADSPEFAQFQLSNSEDFYFLNQGSSPVVQSIDDAEDFVSMRQALTVLGINSIRQMEIFRILAGILHLGNIEVREDVKGSEGSYVPESDNSIKIACTLLGIDKDQMKYWLCNRKIVTATEVLTKPLTVLQVYFARDALAKHIYSQLFLWIVAGLNKALTSSSKIAKFIGVLDIYGFETFEINSFEQFCINYANEKLQQQFCLHVFKLEQEEYVREAIEWSMIDFYDNQPCIDLIEGKLGILDLLDEECKMPNGSDTNWCQKLYDKHGKNVHFEKPRMSRVAFIVHHFADNVEYQIDGFIEKNRDTVLDEHINIMKASEYELVAELFGESGEPSATPAATNTHRPGRGGVTVRASTQAPKSGQQNQQRKKTVGSQFRESLTLLMETLFSTTPHYVRCIKPNDQKQPFTFDPIRAVQQLRACGVLETIRISAAGYPSRWTYMDFFKRYRVLAVSKDILKNDMKKTCENIITKLIKVRDRYQFGKTKIFFRAGQVAYLEKVRSDRLRSCSILIQKIVRGFLAKRRFAKIRRTALLLQKYGRGLLARRHALFLRRSRAATLIRAYWLRWRCRRRYLRIRHSIMYIQSYARGLFGRKHFGEVRTEVRVRLIQRCVRGWRERLRYKQFVRGVTYLQANVRRRIARRELQELKIEARSVEHMKSVARGLENKIIELQQKLDEKSKEASLLQEETIHVNELRNELTKLRGTHQASKEFEDRIKELEAMVERLKSDLTAETREKELVLTDRENIRREKDDIINMMKQEKSFLKEQLEQLNLQLQQRESGQEELTRGKIEAATKAIQAELESERAQRQKLIKDYGRLEQRFENLQNSMMLQVPGSPATARRGHGVRRTPSSVSNLSTDSEINDDRSEQDQGYGTARKKSRENQPVVNGEGVEVDSLSSSTRTGKSPMPSPVQSPQLDKRDIPLMGRLHARIKDLEKDKARLMMDLDRREFRSDLFEGSAEHSEMEIYDALRLQELEMENVNLRNELSSLQKTIADGAMHFDVKGVKTKVAARQLIENFELTREELKQQQIECSRLRALLATRAKAMDGKVAAESYGGDKKLINEDGELEMAYRTQKDLNNLLEKELQRLQKVSELREVELKQELASLRAENERYQKLAGQNVSAEERLEAATQQEISRLAAENLELREQIDVLQEKLKKWKRAVKIYAKRLKENEVLEAKAEWKREMAAFQEQQNQMPAVHYLEPRDYLGMFEYRNEDEQNVVKNLVIDLKPPVVVKYEPACLPAFVMFMCLRHTDHINDDEKVRSLLTGSINGIKKIVKKHGDDIEMVSMWLANTVRLLHCMRQYSGEKSFQTENTPKQNEHCLRNFDLTDYRQILNDLAVWIYHGLVKLVEGQLQPMIVGALLENEAIAGLSTGKQSVLRRTSSSPADSTVWTPESLIKLLDTVVNTLTSFAVDTDLVKQLMKQIFYFLCANALNSLLLRKDMCHWMKGMQIRFNLSQLEQWLREKRLHDGGALDVMEPLIEATQLLQARKTDADVSSICEMCSHLSTPQIIKILNLYTPTNEFEERVPISFIRKIQECLSARQETSQSLLMDTKLLYAVTFPFVSSPVSLETIEVPLEWNLSCLKKL